MIARLQIIVRIITFAAALWLLAVVIWGLATGATNIEPPRIAIWLFFASLLARVGLWLVGKVVRSS